MNLLQIEVQQYFHKHAQNIYDIILSLDHFKVNSDRACEQRKTSLGGWRLNVRMLSRTKKQGRRRSQVEEGFIMF